MLPDPELPPEPEPEPEPELPLAPELPEPVLPEPAAPPDPEEPDDPVAPAEPAEPVPEPADVDPVPAVWLVDDPAGLVPDAWALDASTRDPAADVPGNGSCRAARPRRPGTVFVRDAPPRLPPDGVTPGLTAGADVAGARVTPPAAGSRPDDGDAGRT